MYDKDTIKVRIGGALRAWLDGDPLTNPAPVGPFQEIYDVYRGIAEVVVQKGHSMPDKFWPDELDHLFKGELHPCYESFIFARESELELS